MLWLICLSQSGHTAGIKLRTKNGAQRTTNVKKTTPRTFVAFCSSLMILPCRELFREATLLVLEWWLRIGPEYLCGHGEDELLLCLELMLAAPLWARMVAARRIGPPLVVNSAVLVFPVELKRGIIVSQDLIAGAVIRFNRIMARFFHIWSKKRCCYEFLLIRLAALLQSKQRTIVLEDFTIRCVEHDSNLHLFTGKLTPRRFFMFQSYKFQRRKRICEIFKRMTRFWFFAFQSDYMLARWVIIRIDG